MNDGTVHGQDPSADRDALLRLLLADEGIELRHSQIERRPDDAPAILSYQQERMWFLDQFEEDGNALGVHAAIELIGPLDLGVLRRCLDEIVRRHAVLRTMVPHRAGQPEAFVVANAPMPFDVVDLDGDEDALAHLLAVEAGRSFDLGSQLPVHVLVVRMADERHVLSTIVHHVAIDGWSFGLYFRELGVLYPALLAGQPSPLPELSIQYADYAWWQRHGAEATYESQLEYWRQLLGRNLPVFEIPPDHQRPPRQNYTGGSVRARVPDDVALKLADVAAAVGATTYMTLLASFEVAVARHVGATDVVIGTPVAGRSRPELAPLLGAFLNTLVVHNDLGGNPTFSELLAQVRDSCLDAFDHQDVPFELVLAELEVPRDASRTPLFQIFFNMLALDGSPTELGIPGFCIRELELPDIPSKFDLTLYVYDLGSGIDLQLVYASSLYEHEHMAALLDQYLAVLRQVADDPNVPIDALDLASPAAALLPHDTAPLDDTWHGPVPAAVRRAAASAPTALAIDDRHERWTYRDVDAQMVAIAEWLRARHVGPGGIVAIHALRCGSLVPAVLGVLAAGAAYVILDPRHPPARLAMLLDVAAPTAWISLHGESDVPAEVTAALDRIDVGHRLSLPRTSDPAVLRGALGVEPDEAAVDAAIAGIGPDSVACLTFTSGSTGTPKAVVGRHGPLTHFLPWMSDHFGVGTGDRFSVLSGLAHDPLQRDLFWPLWVGATIVVPDQDVLLEPVRLAGWMRESSISVAHLTPALGQLLLDGIRPGTSSALPDLRLAMFIGDVLTRGEAERLFAVAPATRIVNLYGATETQRASGFHELGRDELAAAGGTRRREVLPLGIGMPGSQLLVRRPGGAPAAVGEVGEVVMRSPHLALGYHADPDLTATRFTPGPSEPPGDRCYATGDRGRYRSDGTVEFLGRLDDQVQVRGHRVEPGEVAGVLRRHTAIADAAVLARADTLGHVQLVAYVVGQDAPVEPADVVAWCRGELPGHMVPARVVVLPALPLTPNGKLDRAALPDPDDATAGTVGDGAPRDSLERMLVDVWERVLGRREVGIHDDFFALGGYSLLATRLFALVEERIGIRLPVAVLFEHPTIASLAEVVRNGGWSLGWSSLVPIQPAGAGTPFFYVAPYTISVLQLAPLGEALGTSRPLYGLQPQGLDGTRPAHDSIAAMAEHYLAELRMVQPVGPYALGGHCSGAWVAFEMARQLEAMGEHVASLVLVDQGPPGVERPRISPLRYLANRVGFYLRDGRLRHALAWQARILTARLLLRRVGPASVRFEERVRAVHRAAFGRYRGGRVGTDLTLVLSSESLMLDDKHWFRRWADLTAGSLTVRTVDGTHANLLVQPYVAGLAREVERAVRLAEASAADDGDHPPGGGSNR